MVVGLEEVTEIGRVAGVEEVTEIVRVVGAGRGFRNKVGCRGLRGLQR